MFYSKNCSSVAHDGVGRWDFWGLLAFIEYLCSASLSLSLRLTLPTQKQPQGHSQLFNQVWFCTGGISQAGFSQQGIAFYYVPIPLDHLLYLISLTESQNVLDLTLVAASSF